MLRSPEIVLGPPGTGKTTRLLSMVDEELSRGVPPDRIGYVSFTKKAAMEAVDRACEKFSLDKRDLRWFRTLHSLCFQALGLSNSDVFEGKKTMEFGSWLGIRLSEHRRMDETSLFGYQPGDRALFMENLARVRGVDLRDAFDEDDDGLSWGLVRRIGLGLEKYKKEHQLYDYTDMLTMFVRSDYSPQLEVLFVDEAQDLSRLQWQVVQKLAEGARRVVIAGDDDQAIYRWAGAAVQDFIDMDGRVTVLGQSWRVPRSVQQISMNVISGVKSRRDKQWSPKDDEGQLSRVSSFEEVDLWGDDILVLGRNAYVLRNLEDYLRSSGVIYEFRGHSSVRQSTLTAIKAWEHLRKGGEVAVEDAKRVYALMSSGKGVRRGFKELPGLSPADSISLAGLTESGGLMRNDIWHQALDRMADDERDYMLKALKSGERLTGRPRIRLSTIHGAKGGEADHVVILRDMADRTWQEARRLPEDEARVWYVGVTRSQRQLSIVSPKTRKNYDL